MFYESWMIMPEMTRLSQGIPIRHYVAIVITTMTFTDCLSVKLFSVTAEFSLLLQHKSTTNRLMKNRRFSLSTN